MCSHTPQTRNTGSRSAVYIIFYYMRMGRKSTSTERSLISRALSNRVTKRRTTSTTTHVHRLMTYTHNAQSLNRGVSARARRTRETVSQMHVKQLYTSIRRLWWRSLVRRGRPPHLQMRAQRMKVNCCASCVRVRHGQNNSILVIKPVGLVDWLINVCGPGLNDCSTCNTMSMMCVSARQSAQVREGDSRSFGVSHTLLVVYFCQPAQRCTAAINCVCGSVSCTCLNTYYPDAHACTHNICEIG